MIEIGNTHFTDQQYILEIKDKNKQVKARYVMGDKDVHKKTLMAEDSIQFSFMLATYLPFLRGDHIIYQGKKYTLRDNYPPELKTGFFAYNLQFEAEEMLLRDIQYYYIHQDLKEVSWSLTATAGVFLQLVVDNINRYFKSTDWKVGIIEPIETKLINFDNTNLFDGLKQIADTFKAEWYVADSTINLVQQFKIGTAIDFNADEQVMINSISQSQDKSNFTRIIALGSSRNIPANYRQITPSEGVDAIYQKRLRIPQDQGDTIDVRPDLSPEEVIEGTVIFDEVYPKRIGKLSHITTKEYTDTDETTKKTTKWNAYCYQDPELKFDASYKLPGQDLRISFSKSKRLNGLDFAVQFYKDSNTFEIVRNTDYGKAIPNDTLYPEEGDEYILYGFNIQLVANEYVPAAEQELYDKAKQWIKDKLKDTSVYECQSVIAYFASHQMDLSLGQAVKLIHPVISGGSTTSRIMGFEKKLINPYDAIYTIGDNPAYSRLSNIDKKIDELKLSAYDNASKGSGPYVIKQFDTTPASDMNVYSSKASNAQYFNKQTGDHVIGDTLFDQNVQINGIGISDVLQNSTFTAGQLGSGWQVKRDTNGQSYLEVDNLLVRRQSIFNKLSIAEIKSIDGTILISLASMTVLKVEEQETTWRCYFDNLKGRLPNEFVVGDQVIARTLGKTEQYYWSLVTAIGDDYIEVSKTDKDGQGIPEKGHEIVQLGHRGDVNRQYAILLSTIGVDAPSIKQYAGINSYDLTGKEITAISPAGNHFTGSFIVSSHGISAPVYKERGLFVNGQTYNLNDRVSLLGSYWLCMVNQTKVKPNETTSDWRKETAGQSDIDSSTAGLRKEYKADLIVLDTKIASKVSQSVVDELTGRVEVTESKIEQTNEQIDLIVKKMDNQSELKIDGNEIYLGSSKITLDGQTIAKSIQAGDLVVGQDSDTAQLKILKTGEFYAKGTGSMDPRTKTEPLLAISSAEQSIEIVSPTTQANYNQRFPWKTTIDISAQASGISIYDDQYHASLVTATGMVSRGSGHYYVSPVTGVTQIGCLIGQASGHLNTSSDDNKDFIAGVIGHADNIGNAPTYGGYFDILKTNGLCMNVRLLDQNQDVVLTKEDLFVSYYAHNWVGINLCFDPYIGQTFYIRHCGGSGFTVNGSNHGIITGSGKVSKIDISQYASLSMFVFDGWNWTFNKQGV